MEKIQDSDPESCHTLAGLLVVTLFGFGDFGPTPASRPLAGFQQDFSGTMSGGQTGHLDETRGTVSTYDGLCAGGTQMIPLTPHGVMLSCQIRVSSILAHVF